MRTCADIYCDEGRGEGEGGGNVREDDDVDVSDKSDGAGYLCRIRTDVEHGVPDRL